VAPGDEGFTRRIGAVLVLERDLDPALPGEAEDDALARALALLRRTGDAERIAAGLVAGFDTPAAAVTAANGLHGEFRAAGGPRWRAGIDVGEILMTPGDPATGAAIERATALARLARAGTTARIWAPERNAGGGRNACLLSEPDRTRGRDSTGT
jgi:hypothetical protein